MEGDTVVGFLERLFKKKEPEVYSISLGAVPAWLSEREQNARSALRHETSETQARIRTAIRNLSQITETVAKAEQDPEAHPKLRSIAKNSLPQFVKAMHASLGKELPDDIEEFYSAVVECLKNCMNITRGQGRYLQVVFPEEMKAVRSGIDSIGREMNEITAALGRYRKEKDLIKTALSLQSALVDLRMDISKAREKDGRISLRMTELAEKISGIEEELRTSSADNRMAEVDELKTALLEAEKTRDTVMRVNAALSMTASHVFRKAEKIAVRQKHPSEIAALRNAMELLSDHAVPEKADIADALGAACPIAERMVNDGEIALKNKEERAIFSDTRRFCTEICTSYSDLEAAEEACMFAEQRLASHPLLVRISSLERERAQLGTMQKKEEQSRIELAEWMKKTEEKIPGLLGDLTKKMEEMAGGRVQIQSDEQTPA